MTHQAIKKAKKLFKLWSWRKVTLVIYHDIVSNYNPVINTYMIDENKPIQWILQFQDKNHTVLEKIYILALNKDIHNIYKYITNFGNQ